MENNPVKQRVITLTEQWRQAVVAMPDIRMFCWVGASSVDYKMIQGFIMYHMSEESAIADIFFCFKHPFIENSSFSYGTKIIHDIAEYIKVWNNDNELVENTGIISWQPAKKDEKDTDASYFIKNINLLADKLKINGKDQFLAVAILPQSVDEFNAYTDWLADVIRSGISFKVRLMVYDTYDFNAFNVFSKQFPSLFHKIHTDLNMGGAMHQILENTKAEKKDKQEKDAVSFQQLIIKITEAIGQNDKKKIDVYMKQSREIAQEHDWPHMEAIVYYFVHSWFAINNQQEEAHKMLDNAILKNDDAFDKKILVNEDIKYHYRIAKGNLYFMNKQFEEAAQVYKTCIQLNRDGIDKQLLLGVYQMLGTSLKHSSGKKNAWAFFVEGWEMVKNEPEDSIRSNKFIQYYAKEMLDVADNSDSFIYYNELFKSYWGNDWKKSIKDNSTAVLTKRETVFS